MKSAARLTILLAFTMIQSAGAQWSHREGDPMPAPAGFLVQPFTPGEWEASNFAPQADIERFRDARYGMFIHFGLSTHAQAELSWGTCHTRKAPDTGQGPVPDEVWQGWTNEFRFEKFNAQEWVGIAQRAGVKYLVVIAKHHEGFHLWDTAHSDFKVTHTPFGRDLLKELADACHAAGMTFGIYYAQREWHHPDYQPVDESKVIRNGVWWKLKPGEKSPVGPRHSKYLDYNRKAVRELLTNYGRVDIFWWDAAWWGGMFTAEMWDAENLTRMVRELQPRILENNRCSVPGDFDTPEQRLGNYQDWRPWESCMCLEQGWSYTGAAPKPRDHILRMLINNACCDGNLLLSWGPKWNGEFDEAQKNRLFEVGGWLEKNGRSIYSTRGGPWKFAAWGGSTRRGATAYLHVLEWPGETLRLPALPQRQARSARLLGGAEIPFRQAGGTLEITVPKTSRDPLDTIIEIIFDQPLDGLKAIASGDFSSFDAVTYGQVVSRQAVVTTSSRHPSDQGQPQTLVAESPAGDFAFHTNPELNPWVQIDLGHETSVTGVRILNRAGAGEAGRNRAATLRLSVSKDGKQWQETWRAEGARAVWEIPVTDFLAGAQVPGRSARYVRLELRPDYPECLHLRQVEVWGK